MKKPPYKPLLLLSLLSLWLLAGCTAPDDGTDSGDTPPAETVVVNVDVVLPVTIRQQWQNATDWALANIDKAQQKQPRRVKLRLRYHDEDTADLDSLARRLTNPQAGDDTCHAIIGPYHSDNAQTFLSHAARTRLPVVMPTCTSAELQRTNARNTYAWFLTESDITQCEIMISAARSFNSTDIALIYSPDTYGRSFADWFAFYAAEQDLHIAGGMSPYVKGDDLTPFLRSVLDNSQGEQIQMLVALSDAGDYRHVCDQISRMSNLDSERYITLLCADTSCDLQVLMDNDFTSFQYGITPSASMGFGFSQSYSGRFLQPPMYGEAQMYDALTIVALGEALRQASPDSCSIQGKPLPYEPRLTDYMRSVTSSFFGTDTQWDAHGLATAFDELANGRPIVMSGATGQLSFDIDTHTKALNTTYMIWRLDLYRLFTDSDPFARFQPLIYLSTSGTFGETSTTSLWKMEKKLEQTFDEIQNVHRLPPVGDHWAVVVSPSTTWPNYRHQADAFAMYQLLRTFGYDDDHIVLIAEDNLAYDSRNPFPGQIFVDCSDDADPLNTLAGVDVRAGTVVDYRFSDLVPDDLADILLGRPSSRLPHVIRPDSASNVFLFWSGHGGSADGPLWGDEDARTSFGTRRIRDIVRQMNDADLYRRMMLAVETCYSGLWGEALTGLPDVLVLTAANTRETSKADLFDQQLGVYLSNAFARTFRSQVSIWPDITLYDLYRELYKATAGSHVTIYNHQEYGSVYTETMADYFPF